MRTFGVPLVLFGALLSIGSRAQAAEVTRVATSFEDDNRFDIHLGLVEYGPREHDVRNGRSTAAVRGCGPRELAGLRVARRHDL